MTVQLVVHCGSNELYQDLSIMSSEYIMGATEWKSVVGVFVCVAPLTISMHIRMHLHVFNVSVYPFLFVHVQYEHLWLCVCPFLCS
jgi:hypothetical protein